MKITIILLFVLYYGDCRKTYVPIDKNANLAFINMEGGGVSQPKIKPAVPNPTVVTTAKPVPAAPAPVAPAPTPNTLNTVQTTAKPVQPMAPTQPKPQPVQPPQIQPKPVNPSPVANPITTPGPGSVKQLINFYDSQGKASPIRPYTYSQAVKQG